MISTSARHLIFHHEDSVRDPQTLVPLESWKSQLSLCGIRKGGSQGLASKLNSVKGGPLCWGILVDEIVKNIDKEKYYCEVVWFAKMPFAHVWWWQAGTIRSCVSLLINKTDVRSWYMVDPVHTVLAFLRRIAITSAKNLVGICRWVPDHTRQNPLRLLTQCSSRKQTLVQGQRSNWGGEAHHLSSQDQMYCIR